MIEIVIGIIGFMSSLLVGGGVLFYKQNKKFKEAEAALKKAEANLMEKDVLSKDLQNEKSIAGEWVRLYEEQTNYSKKLEGKIQVLNDELKAKNKTIGEFQELDTKQRLLIANLNWARCEVNGCEKRRPPRDFQTLINETEDMHDTLNDDDAPKRRAVKNEFHYDHEKSLNIAPPEGVV